MVTWISFGGLGAPLDGCILQLQFENTLVFFCVVADSVLVVVVVLDIRIVGVVEFRPSVVVCDLSRRLSGGISVLGFQESEHAARQTELG